MKQRLVVNVLDTFAHASQTFGVDEAVVAQYVHLDRDQNGVVGRVARQIVVVDEQWRHFVVQQNSTDSFESILGIVYKLF